MRSNSKRVVFLVTIGLALLAGSSFAMGKGGVKTSYERNEENEADRSFSPALRVKVNADDVNLRCKPQVDAQIVTTLKKGSIVEVEQKTDKWCKVKYGRQFGYISEEYLELPQNMKEYDYPTLTMGMSSAEVLKLQETLEEQGYYNGSCNGTYGAKTREAVRKFEKDNDLEVDGIADNDMQRKLYDN